MGVFLKVTEFNFLESRLPHARGGVSQDRQDRQGNQESSPRPWGCFYRAWLLRPYAIVFPTPVGVFPTFVFTRIAAIGLPHARGGVSLISEAAK